jgi:hypothetical protein
MELLEHRLLPTSTAYIEDTFAGPILHVDSDDPGNTITFDHSGSAAFVTIDNANWIFDDSLFDFIEIGERSGGSTVNLLGIPAGRSTGVHLGASTTVNLGVAGSAQEILSSVGISSEMGQNATVNIDDYADTGFRTANITTTARGEEITGLTPSGAPIDLGDITLAYVYTGTGGAALNVQNLRVNTYLVGNASNTAVNVGSGGSVQGILADLDIYNSSSRTGVTIDDSGDHVSRTVFQSTDSNNPGFGQITGLAPHPIYYWYSSTAGVTMHTGYAGATVNVEATGTPLALVGHGSTAVNLGSGHSVQNLHGDVTMTNPPSFTTINVDNSADIDNHNTALTTTGLTGTISGLAPANINFAVNDITALTINGGNGNNAYAVTIASMGQFFSTTLNTGSGRDTVNMLATEGPLTINWQGGSNSAITVGDGTLANIRGAVSLANSPGIITVNVDDRFDNSDHPAVALSAASLTGLPAQINFAQDAVALTVRLGNGSNTYTITGTPVAGRNTTTELDTGSGVNTVTVLHTDGPTMLTGNPAGSNTLIGPNVDSTWNITSQNGGTLNGTVSFSGFQNLTGGSGNDTFAFSDGQGVDGTINGGGRTNTLDYSAYSTTVIVDLQTGTATGVGGSVQNIQNVIGGTGGAPGVYNILVGHGDNVLFGGDGRRNLLIAGGSASTLIGGNDDDILIGGTTAYDTEAGLVSLRAIMDYWSSTADDYATRVGNLLSGNGVPLLDASVVTSNGGGNTLLGQNGGSGELNLFYGADPTLELVTDYQPDLGEQFINC